MVIRLPECVAADTNGDADDEQDNTYRNKYAAEYADKGFAFPSAFGQCLLSVGIHNEYVF